MTIDYYQILGVLDDAEDIVIRAAYKALSQKYHPDKWDGDQQEAHRRMAELNQAYGVLSDQGKRNQYDSTRDRSTFTAEEDSPESTLLSSVERDWRVAVEYMPHLNEIVEYLGALSRVLEYTFKVTLLEHKSFADAYGLASRLERNYLGKYFGKDPQIIKFAKSLLTSKNRAAARELNVAVSVLGAGVDPHAIITRISDKFNLTSNTDAERRWNDIVQLSNVVLGSVSVEPELSHLLMAAGCAVRETGFFKITTYVSLGGVTKKFTAAEFAKFGKAVAKEVLKFKSLDVVKSFFHPTNGHERDTRSDRASGQA